MSLAYQELSKLQLGGSCGQKHGVAICQATSAAELQQVVVGEGACCSKLCQELATSTWTNRKQDKEEPWTAVTAKTITSAYMLRL